jgi:hypothetical protein
VHASLTSKVLVMLYCPAGQVATACTTCMSYRLRHLCGTYSIRHQQ